MAADNRISSYIFRLQEPAVPLPISLHTIGWETTSSVYSFAGIDRDDPGGAWLFQYTVEGHAMIRVGDQLYRLGPGKAFFVPFKSDYHYYKTDENECYECLFLTLDGEEAAKCFEYLERQAGPVMDVTETETPIRLLRHMYQEARDRKITDAYKLSLSAYQFVTELYRYVAVPRSPSVWPEVIVKALRRMDEQYFAIRHLDELTGQLGISKFHFIKVFRRTVGKTPIEYLTKVRMEKALDLLRNTDDSLEDIAEAIGYSHVNYFSKVFRKFFGVSPGQMRKKMESYNFLLD